MRIKSWAQTSPSVESTPLNVKVVPPTTDILGKPKTPQSTRKDKDVCSNASDYGSEDTFISLGTKIKAKAQVTPKYKNSGAKNNFKFRNISRKTRRPMDNFHEDNTEPNYGFEIKITERPQMSQSLIKDDNTSMIYGRNSSPTFKDRPYESYFLPLEMDRKVDNKSLDNKTFTDPNIQADVEQAIDIYTKRLTLTKQQLSLVEEESTQDLESVPSQNFSSLSPENSLDDKNANEKPIMDDELTGRNTCIVKVKSDENPKARNFTEEPKTYNSFYDDFHSSNFDTYKPKMSSTIVHTDSSSKDSGYPDSGPNDEKLFQQNYSLPPAITSPLKKSNSYATIEDQPKSLDSASTSSNDKYYHKTFPLDKKWAEPLNHSRLLYKDFFIKKEGHITLAPQNSPNKHESDNIPRRIDAVNIENTQKENVDSDYPPYLVNSTTKAYTSKVIEDYKKELEAINNLHELTLKDLKTDAISPTPLNIDKMFEQNSSYFIKDNIESIKTVNDDIKLTESPQVTDVKDNDKQDVTKISTKELIQNYFKVKEGDYGKEYACKNLRKFDKTPINSAWTNSTSKSEENSVAGKQNWNNKNSKKINNNTAIPVNIRNQNQRTIYTARAPLSARIEGVQNDKDVDSWMSLSAPSPRLLGIEEIEANAVTVDNNTIKINVERDKGEPYVSALDKKEETPKVAELNSKSSVFDIYSMLKEIESYGENPVTTVASVDVPSTKNTMDPKKDEESAPPKDNFLEIFEFLEKVEQSANDALSVVTSTTPQTIPKLESLLKLPQTELAQRLVTASLQLEERSCCIALLQESLTNHKEQVARQRWVRQKAEKIKELTVKGLEGELREMADRQQKEIADLKMQHAEQCGRAQAKHAAELEALRRTLEEEKDAALQHERQLASSRYYYVFFCFNLTKNGLNYKH
ncbi:unnamed protein product [Diatraea saccharalis]|uniref:Uncharacterized protein n=1 Tax=Diatraea saccharalis TaxID=40085 RepID=A0A9N9WAA0_9NEOP|nr:unnamed protein product [Diatraea saccharalis]